MNITCDQSVPGLLAVCQASIAPGMHAIEHSCRISFFFFLHTSGYNIIMKHILFTPNYSTAVNSTLHVTSNRLVFEQITQPKNRVVSSGYYICQVKNIITRVNFMAY